MHRNVISGLVSAIAILLFAVQANADSPWDDTGVEDLKAAYDYAGKAYQERPWDVNAYYAQYYAYYAQYFAQVARGSHERIAWYYAFYYSQYAAMYSHHVYETAGNLNSFYASFYLSDTNGAGYSYAAYVDFK